MRANSVHGHSALFLSFRSQDSTLVGTKQNNVRIVFDLMDQNASSPSIVRTLNLRPLLPPRFFETSLLLSSLVLQLGTNIGIVAYVERGSDTI